MIDVDEMMAKCPVVHSPHKGYIGVTLAAIALQQLNTSSKLAHDEFRGVIIEQSHIVNIPVQCFQENYSTEEGIKMYSGRLRMKMETPSALDALTPTAEGEILFERPIPHPLNIKVEVRENMFNNGDFRPECAVVPTSNGAKFYVTGLVSSDDLLRVSVSVDIDIEDVPGDYLPFNCLCIKYITKTLVIAVNDRNTLCERPVFWKINDKVLLQLEGNRNYIDQQELTATEKQQLDLVDAQFMPAING